MITRVATVVIRAVPAVLLMLGLAWMAEWMSTLVFRYSLFEVVFVGAVAIIVRFFARRALPRMPPDRNRGPFDGKR